MNHGYLKLCKLKVYQPRSPVRKTLGAKYNRVGLRETPGNQEYLENHEAI